MILSNGKGEKPSPPSIAKEKKMKKHRVACSLWPICGDLVVE